MFLQNQDYGVYGNVDSAIEWDATMDAWVAMETDLLMEDIAALGETTAANAAATSSPAEDSAASPPQSSQNQLVFLDESGSNGTSPFDNYSTTPLDNSSRAQFPAWADDYDKLIIDVLFTGFSEFVNRIILATDDNGKAELHFGPLKDREGAMSFLKNSPEFITGSFGGEHVRDTGETDASKVFDARSRTRGEHAVEAQSLQINIGKTTGIARSDRDRFNPYEFPRGFFGHVFLEVLPDKIRHIF
jgi:hypothetical protein